MFAQGAQWQFKYWLLGEGIPSRIFSKIKGFHLKLSGIPLDSNIAKWSVTTIELDARKRHLDRARLLTFWDELDRYIYGFGSVKLKSFRFYIFSSLFLDL